MLTRKPSDVMDDVRNGNPLLSLQRNPSAFAAVPPTLVAGPDWQGGEPEACKLVSVNLSAYLDDELDPDQADLITNHLGTCADCAALMATIEETDEVVQREWREDSPLPSSSQFKQSIDAIMDALPPARDESVHFAAKRVHSRARWVRAATGMSGAVVAAALLWSSYRLGYAHGRTSVKPSPAAVPSESQMLVRSRPSLSFASFASLPATPSLHPSRPSRERGKGFP